MLRFTQENIHVARRDFPMGTHQLPPSVMTKRYVVAKIGQTSQLFEMLSTEE
jgi:hypothetical protein